MSEMKEIPLDLLVWHESTQFSKLFAMIEAAFSGTDFPPIHVIAAGSKYMIIDGAHRAQTAQACRRKSIAAVIHELPACSEVPGWSHLISAPVARRLVTEHRSPAGTDGVADVLLDGQLIPLGPHAASAEAQHLAFHTIGMFIEDDLATAHDGAVLFTWHPPRLEVLVDIALYLSPLPHTVTQFEPLINSHRPSRIHAPQEHSLTTMTVTAVTGTR